MLVCLRILATFVGGSLIIVTGIVLSDKALTPLPRTPEYHPQDRRLEAENETLRLRVLHLEGDLVKERADHMQAKLLLDTLRRNAVWFPPRDEVRAEDRIPAQALPIPEARP